MPQHEAPAPPACYVVTGASGAGKSTLIAALAAAGHATVPEAALALLQDQQARPDGVTPWTHRPAFMTALLERSLMDYHQAQSLTGPVFFDRAVPECLAWMRQMQLPIPPALVQAAGRCIYAPQVFVAEPWAEIYARTAERPFAFERAVRSFDATVAAYAEAGYRLCVLPRVPVAERVAFVLDQLGPLHGT